MTKQADGRLTPLRTSISGNNWQVSADRTVAYPDGAESADRQGDLLGAGTEGQPPLRKWQQSSPEEDYQLTGSWRRREWAFSSGRG